MSALAGTGTLLRLALRRDRLRIAVWVVAVAGSVVAVARRLPGLYPTAAERQSRAVFVDSPVVRAFRGPGHGLDDYTIGAMLANEVLLYGLIAVALMGVLTVVRHTRAEEESGRADLVRAGAVGAQAPVAAALALAGAAAVLTGGLTTAGLVLVVPELSAAGSLAVGGALAAVGIAFAGVGALAAQAAETARGAAGAGAAALGLAFALRAVGDIGGGGGPSWLSPLGWSQATRAYVDERWWPLLLSPALAAGLCALAVALVRRRDVGAGLVRPRPGRPTASRRLTTPLGLAVRLQRGPLAGWTVAVVGLGLVFGSVAGEAEAFLQDNPRVEQLLGPAAGVRLLDAFLAVAVLVLALVATGAALQAALRARAEELEGRAEPLLATPLPRARWAGAHLAVALAGGAAAVLLGAVALGAVAAAEEGDPALVPRVLLAGLAHVSAMWLVVAVAAALFGLWPGATTLGWGVLALAAFVGLLGEAVGLPEGARRLSPFEHVPRLPGGDVTAVPLAVLVALAVALLAAGLAGVRRRDVGAP